MDLSRDALTSLLLAKTLKHTKKQGFGYPGLKFHQKQLKLSPVSERSA